MLGLTFSRTDQELIDIGALGTGGFILGGLAGLASWPIAYCLLWLWNRFSSRPIALELPDLVGYVAIWAVVGSGVSLIFWIWEHFRVL